MVRSKIAGIGKYVPEQIVTNNDLFKYMDTTDAWINERTDIVERRYAQGRGETTTTMPLRHRKLPLNVQALRYKKLTLLFLPP